MSIGTSQNLVWYRNPANLQRSPDRDCFLHQFLPRAEALGYEGLWVQEQILGDVPVLEPVTLLTYAAALTSKVHLGTSVMITVVRNPLANFSRRWIN